MFGVEGQQRLPALRFEVFDVLRFVQNQKIIGKKKPAFTFHLLLDTSQEHEKERMIDDDDLRVLDRVDDDLDRARAAMQCHPIFDGQCRQDGLETRSLRHISFNQPERFGVPGALFVRQALVVFDGLTRQGRLGFMPGSRPPWSTSGMVHANWP